MSLLMDILVALIPGRSRSVPFDPTNPFVSPELFDAGLAHEFTASNERYERKRAVERDQLAQKRQEIVEFLRKGAETGRKLAQSEVSGTLGDKSHAAFTAALKDLRRRDAEAWQAVVELAGHMYGHSLTEQVLRDEFHQTWHIYSSGTASRMT